VPTSFSATEIPNQIQQLLEQRDQHTSAISQIDRTLAKVTAALGGETTPAAITKPAGVPAAAKGVPARPVKVKTRKRTKFAISATDLVLQFIQANPSPTTKQITQHLVSEGRSTGAVSNALSVLTKSKTLKRTPLGKGIMGSKYSLA
jgi:hypothetical protein